MSAGVCVLVGLGVCVLGCLSLRVSGGILVSVSWWVWLLCFVMCLLVLLTKFFMKLKLPSREYA